jgi:hypothetical protein
MRKMAGKERSGSELSLERASKPTEEGVTWLRDNITKLREKHPRKFTAQALGTLINNNSHKIYNFLRGSATLDASDHKTLVEYVFKQLPNWEDDESRELTSSNIEDDESLQRTSKLFHAFVRFLEVTSPTLDHLKDQAPGVYTVWRASTHIPGKFVKGIIRIEFQESLKIVKLQELQRYKGGDGTTPISETFDGFIIKKSRHYVMITRQVGHSGPPRVTIIDNVLYDENHKIAVMQGMTTGCYGANELFCAPIYLERSTRDTSELESELDIVDEIPASVKAKLDATVSNGIIWF